MTAHEQHRSSKLFTVLKTTQKKMLAHHVPADSWIRSREWKLGLGAEQKESGQRLGSNFS